MFGRKTSFERGLDKAEANTAVAVNQLADSIREKVGGEQGVQIAQALNQLADRVDALDLADQVRRGRKELQKATKRASKQVERSGKQIAAASAHAVPAEPTNWIVPTVLGLLLGFGAGFFVARATAKKPRDEH